MDSSKYYFDYGRQAWVNKESPDELIVQSIPPVFFPTSRTTSRKPLEIINPESGETLEIKKIDKKEIKEEKQENTEVPKKFPPFPTIPPHFYGMPYPLPFPAGPPGYPFPPPHAYYPHPQQTQAPPPLGQPPKQNNMLFVVDKPKESEPISKPKENPPTQEENQSDSSQEEEEKEEETRKGRGRGNSRNQRNNRNENQRDKGRNHNDNRRNQDRNGNRGRGNRNDNRGRGGRKEEGRGRGRINNNNKDFNGYHNNSGNNSSNYRKRFDDRNGENRNQGNEIHHENNKNEERGRGRGDHHNERGEGGRGRGDRGRGGRVQKPRPLMLPEYYKNGKYTASIDGKFWTLSQWPTGERDETHGCQFGRHKLNVSEDGSVKIVLFGGINDYKISLHYAGEDDPLGNKDPAGWEVARCGPSMADLALTKEAQDLGWTLLEKTRTHPTIYPPGVEPPEEDLNVE